MGTGGAVQASGPARRAGGGERALLVGNSHLLALLDAARRVAGDDEEHRDTAFVWTTSVRNHDVRIEGGPHLHFVLVGLRDSPFLGAAEESGALPPAVADALQAGAAALGDTVDVVVSCFYGGEHQAFALFEHPEPFDVIVDDDDPGVPVDGRPRQIVPRDVITRELARRTRRTVLACRSLQELFPTTPVVHVVSPPPLADDARIREGAGAFRALLDERGLAPAVLRRKLYRLYDEVLTRQLTALGIAVVPPPAEAQIDGFLDPGYALEAAHGNRAYGALVLESLGLLGGVREVR